ncbi:MAG: hypothetical protein ACRYFX_19175 [Janthinobacterium lividum]
MEPINHYSLEEYAERHRADFDLHEPRPELWAALEKQLDGAGPAQPTMSIVPPDVAPVLRPLPTQPALRTPGWGRWQKYGIAAALAALITAAGVGEVWKSHYAPAAGALAAATSETSVNDLLYPGAASTVLAASQGGPDVDARLDTAVHGMERYYLAQLTDRKEQLSQLAPSVTQEWTRELVSLDSSYQQLKRELPRHPQPEVVLTAMNRNLQIRLDILDRQLELHGADLEAVAAGSPGSEFVLADSRSASTNLDK